MRKCLLAMLILMLVILMLLNFNTGYADIQVILMLIYVSEFLSLCCRKNIHKEQVLLILNFIINGGGGDTPSASCGLVQWISASWGHALIDL